MTASPTPPRRRLPLRFSLRVLLLALTAFAIGFPIWYRWPYEESRDESTSIAGPGDPFAAPGAAVPPPTVFKWTLVTTWQRQWGGGRLKHGREREYTNGNVTIERTFRNGQLDGPLKSGALFGQYVDGKKEGVWEIRNDEGNAVEWTTWRSGLLDGTAQVVPYDRTRQARRRQLVFSMGRLTSLDGLPIDDRLGELVAAGKIDSPAVAKALLSETNGGFEETPLKDLADFLSVQHEVPVVVDALHANRECPITGDWPDIHLSSALTILTSEHGHACDYRYGLIWITSAADAQDWHDPTGVSQIVPPPGSQLARAWNEPAACDAIDKPLADALQELSQPLAIGVDTSAIQPADKNADQHPVTLVLKGHPFRHTLGVLLYKARCRCVLDGETLVILPPESH